MQYNQSTELNCTGGDQNKACESTLLECLSKY